VRHVSETCFLFVTLCVYRSCGLLRDLYSRYKNNPDGAIFSSDSDAVDEIHPKRLHWYFFVEYLLLKSGYCVGDLLAPVHDEMGCHISTIPHQLLGFMYFLIFEFTYYQRIYKGATGRSVFILKKDVIQMFINIAEHECESCFGHSPDSCTPAEVKRNKKFNIDFYKYIVIHTCFCYYI
jgi:hypothetical protein